MISITPNELNDFINGHHIVIEIVPSAIGEIYALTSGEINYACPYEASMLEYALWAFNGVG